MGDDQLEIRDSKGTLIASPAPSLRGLLEVRGVGILRFPWAEPAPLALAIKLVARQEVERLPPPQFFDCLGRKLPVLCLHAFDSSSCAKIRAALRQPLLPEA